MKKKLLVFLLTISITVLSIGYLTASASTFSDIKDNDTEEAVEILYSLGIVDGYGNGKFQPDTLLTRAQFCKLVVLAMGKGDLVECYSHLTLYSDVTSTHWAVGYINLASTLGLINGYGNGEFGPEDMVSYGQAVTILLRELGYTSTDIGYYWPEDYVNFAEEIGLDCDLDLSAYDYVSRGDAAILIVALLQSSGSDGKTYVTDAYANTVSNVILLDNEAASDEGYEDCAMVYVRSSTGSYAVYYQQAEILDDSFVGCSGTLLLNENGLVVGFLTDGESYSVEYGILLDNDATSTNGKKHRALFYIDGDIEYYPQVDTLSANLIGSSGLILLNENDYVCAFVENEENESFSTEEDYLLLASSRSEAVFYTGSRIVSFDVDERPSSILVGFWGTLLLNEADEVAGFWENKDADQETVSIESTKNDGFSADGDYSVTASVTVLYQNGGGDWIESDWASIYADINASGADAILYYDGEGEISCILLLEE